MFLRKEFGQLAGGGKGYTKLSKVKHKHKVNAGPILNAEFSNPSCLESELVPETNVWLSQAVGIKGSRSRKEIWEGWNPGRV